jgi:hypothetical protein
MNISLVLSFGCAPLDVLGDCRGDHFAYMHAAVAVAVAAVAAVAFDAWVTCPKLFTISK